MKTYLIIQKSDGLVINSIIWDGIAEWNIPNECLAIENDVAGIGWTWDGAKFVPPYDPNQYADIPIEGGPD